MDSKTRYEKDCLQLSLLAMVQFLLGGVCVLLSLMCLPALIMAIIGLCIAAISPNSQSGASMGLMLAASILLLAVPIGCAYVFFYTGRRLAQHRSYHFCCLVLTLESFFTGIGLVMGIWFAMVMNRQSVKDLFEAGDKASEAQKLLTDDARALQSAAEAPRLPRKKADASLSGFREPERL